MSVVLSILGDPRQSSTRQLTYCPLRSFCCEAALPDPKKALHAVQAAQLKAFFQWMIENAERTPPQVGTLKQYFRILKMIYKRDSGAMLDEDVVSDVNAVSTDHNSNVPC